MKRIVLCDNGEFDKVVDFCLYKDTGIELQSFWDPTQTEHYPTQIEYQVRKTKGVDFKGEALKDN